MATPGIPVHVGQIRDEPRPHRIEVDVAHQLAEVGVLLHDDGLVAVLEEVAHPPVAAVVRLGVPRQEPAHELGEPRRAAPQEQVGVVGEEGPGVEGRPGCRGDVPQAPEERRAVFGIRDDRPPLDPPEDDVVQRAGGIEPCLSGHRRVRPPSWIACSLSGIFH